MQAESGAGTIEQASATPRRQLRPQQAIVLVLILASVLIVADQLTKAWITPRYGPCGNPMLAKHRHGVVFVVFFFLGGRGTSVVDPARLPVFRAHHGGFKPGGFAPLRSFAVLVVHLNFPKIAGKGLQRWPGVFNMQVLGGIDFACRPGGALVLLQLFLIGMEGDFVGGLALVADGSTKSPGQTWLGHINPQRVFQVLTSQLSNL